MNVLICWKNFKNYGLYLVPLVFSGLFFWKLDGASFWFDELVTLRTVLNVNTRAFLVNFLSDQLHPPLYFAFLKFYFELLSFLNLLNQFLIVVLCASLKLSFNLFGAEFYGFYVNNSILQKLEVYNEFTVRLPSALFMTAANVLVFDYFKKKNLLLIGFVTCFLIGTNTKLINYAQEARPYALFVLTFILVLKEFGRVYNAELKLINFKKFIIFNLLLLLTHFFSVFVVGSEILILTWRHKKNSKVIFSSVALGAAFTLMFGGMYEYLNIAKFGFLRKIQPGDLLEQHHGALGHFARWPILYYLAFALAVKKHFKKFGDSDQIYLAGAVFLAVNLTMVYVYTSLWPVFNDRYLVIFIPLQILIITTVNYSISEALLVFVKDRALKSVAMAVVFVMVNTPQIVSQPYFHFRIFDYYETEKYYPLRPAYEAIINDPDYRVSNPYVLEEYQGSYFGYYDQKYQVEQMANLYPDDSNAVKERQLSLVVQKKSPKFFYFIRIRHPETKQEEESINISGYSKKRIFSWINSEAFKFTKEF